MGSDLISFLVGECPPQACGFEIGCFEEGVNKGFGKSGALQDPRFEEAVNMANQGFVVFAAEGANCPVGVNVKAVEVSGIEVVDPTVKLVLYLRSVEEFFSTNRRTEEGVVYFHLLGMIVGAEKVGCITFLKQGFMDVLGRNA